MFIEDIFRLNKFCN